MSWVRVWIHLVFSTKNRVPFLGTTELRMKVYEHIRENSKKKKIWLDRVSGHKDHIHCLISLGKEQTISQVAQLIKGESSHWINQNHLTPQKFEWQNDFWAVSVSESHIDAVRKYIEKQEEHHKKKTFTEEVNEFMKKYGWSFISEKESLGAVSKVF